MISILCSDFPDFTSATSVHGLAIAGRYLVVHVSADDKPIYIHNVYAPVKRQEEKPVYYILVT